MNSILEKEKVMIQNSRTFVSKHKPFFRLKTPHLSHLLNSKTFFAP